MNGKNCCVKSNQTVPKPSYRKTFTSNKSLDTDSEILKLSLGTDLKISQTNQI